MRSVTIFFRKFLLSEYRKLRKGTFLFFTNILLSKNFMAKRWGVKEGGVSRYSFKHFLSQSTEKLRSGTFLFFTKFPVSKNFMAKRLGMKEGGVSRYSVKIFLSHSTEKLRRGTFLCFTKFWYRKNLWIRGGRTEGVSQDNLSKFYVSQYRKISCGNLSVFHKISGIEKLYGKEVGKEGVRSVTISCQNLFVSQYRKTS